MAFPGNYWRLKFKIDCASDTLNRVYELRAQDKSSAQKMAGFILQAEARLLPVGWSILDDPIVSDRGTRKNGYPVAAGIWFPSNTGEILSVGSPPAPEADFTTTPVSNDPDVSFLYRFNTDGGRSAERHLRGLRDSWVADFTNQIVAAATDFNDLDFTLSNTLVSPSPAFNLLYPGPAPLNVAEADALGIWLCTVRDACAIYDLVTPLPARTFNQTVFGASAAGDPKWEFVAVSEKKAGKRFWKSRGRQHNFA